MLGRFEEWFDGQDYKHLFIEWVVGCIILFVLAGIAGLIVWWVT